MILAAVVALVYLLGLVALMAWTVYELWTMPPDDERWDDIAEAMGNRREWDDWR